MYWVFDWLSHWLISLIGRVNGWLRCWLVVVDTVGLAPAHDWSVGWLVGWMTFTVVDLALSHVWLIKILLAWLACPHDAISWLVN